MLSGGKKDATETGVRGAARVDGHEGNLVLQTLCLCSTSRVTSTPGHKGYFGRRNLIQVPFIHCYQCFPKSLRGPNPSGTCIQKVPSLRLEMGMQGKVQLGKGLWSGNPHEGRLQEEISCKVNLMTKARATRDLCKWRVWRDSSKNYLAVGDIKHLKQLYMLEITLSPTITQATWSPPQQLLLSQSISRRAAPCPTSSSKPLLEKRGSALFKHIVWQGNVPSLLSANACNTPCNLHITGIAKRSSFLSVDQSLTSVPRWAGPSELWVDSQGFSAWELID